MGTTLRRLAAGLAGCRVEGTDVGVAGIALDSRRVEPGDVFAALPGTSTDGCRFVDEARARGAVALLAGDGALEETDIPRILSQDPRADASRIAHRLQGDPGESLELFAVTGTNGKTTTAWLIQCLLEPEPGNYGCLGTVAFHTGSKTHASTHTTPDPASLARLLAEIRDDGRLGAALEVSSHALDQDRVAGVRFAGAVFTNLTRDHLDYHGTLDRYLSAKLRLLRHLRPESPVVFPSDDPILAPALGGRAGGVGFGRDVSADVRIVREEHLPHGSRLVLATPSGRLGLDSPLLGPFNASNVAATIALGFAVGRDPDVMAQRLLDFPGVPGRLERVEARIGPTVVVDYAHTPDAVAKALDACRRFTRGRLLAVLGAGGDRDRGKRPLLGHAAQRHADFVILTSDNPRSEDPVQILDDVARGLEVARGPWRTEVDRTAAIRVAIAEGQPGDCVAILGKGHEEYQEIAGTRHPFNDEKVARAALEDAHG